MSEVGKAMGEAAKITPLLPNWLVKKTYMYENSAVREWNKQRAGRDKKFAIELNKMEELEKSLKFEWWNRKRKSECSDPSFIEKLAEFSDSSPAYINECCSIPDFESLLKRCGRMKQVLLSDCGGRLEIVGKKLSFTAIALADDPWGSNNWFEAHKGFDFSDLIGKKIIKVNVCSCEDYEDSEHQLVDTSTMYELICNDKSILKFLFHNISKEYYWGHISVVSCRKTNTEDIYIQNADARVVVVVNLPKRGTTTFTKGNIEFSNVNAYDDCLFKPILLLQLKEKLERGERVVLNDPRLCELSKFQFLYDQIMRNLVSPSQIFTIYCENNPQQCIRNLADPETEPWKRRVSPEDIAKLSAVYDKTVSFISTLTDCIHQKLEVAFEEDLGSYLKRRQEELDV